MVEQSDKKPTRQRRSAKKDIPNNKVAKGTKTAKPRKPRVKKEKEFDPVAYAKQVLRKSTKKTRGYGRALMRSSYLEQQEKLDGSMGLKVRRWWICELCGKDKLGKRDVQMDHIIPIGLSPTLEEWITNLYCDEHGYQVLCKECHAIKTIKDRADIRAAKQSTGSGP